MISMTARNKSVDQLIYVYVYIYMYMYMYVYQMRLYA